MTHLKVTDLPMLRSTSFNFGYISLRRMLIPEHGSITLLWNVDYYSVA